MTIHPDRVASVDRAARLIITFRSRYETVEKLTGVPWYVVGVLHMREASNDFRCCLCNGERIIGTARKTTLVPAGRGPFTTWEASAIDEIKRRKMDAIRDWSIERIAYEDEAWNGWGYWWKGDHTSAYDWAGTDIDHGGKYIADHVWSATAQDKQNGTMPVLRRICELANIKLHFDGEAPIAIASAPVAPVPAPAPSAPAAPAQTAAPAPARVDPQRQVGGLLNLIYSAIRAVLSRKS